MFNFKDALIATTILVLSFTAGIWATHDIPRELISLSAIAFVPLLGVLTVLVMSLNDESEKRYVVPLTIALVVVFLGMTFDFFHNPAGSLLMLVIAGVGFSAVSSILWWKNGEMIETNIPERNGDQIRQSADAGLSVFEPEPAS